ncbi:MAG: hypothetical protein ACI7YS_08950 [Flavobacterium sp.]
MEIKELIEKIEATYPTSSVKKELFVKKLIVNHLTELSGKEFTTAKQELLNNKINDLFDNVDFNNIDPVEIKNLNKKRIELQEYITKELFLIPENYFRGKGIIIGITLSFTFQIINSVYLKHNEYFLYIHLLLILIGFFLGFLVDNKIKKQSESLKF